MGNAAEAVRQSYYVVSPIVAPGTTIDAGAVLSLTEARAKEWEAFLRPSTATDLIDFGRAPIPLE